MIANGDVASIEDAAACLSASGAAAVMIGRAAVGRPWLVGQIGAALDGRSRARAAPTTRRPKRAIEHYQGLLSLFGRGIGLRHARKHLAAYADAAREAGAGRRRAPIA